MGTTLKMQTVAVMYYFWLIYDAMQLKKKWKGTFTGMEYRSDIGYESNKIIANL
jgi:hypothetical protein